MTDYDCLPRFTRTEIEEKLSACEGRTLGDVDSTGVFGRMKEGKDKGVAGKVIEQSVLGLEANSRQDPDLVIDGVLTELKTTGLLFANGKDGSKGYSAKEPVSITAVSPENILQEDFETSHFWRKAAHLLFVYYLFNKGKKYADFIIKGHRFFDAEGSFVRFLLHDWALVRDIVDICRRDYSSIEEGWRAISSDRKRNLLVLDTAPKWPPRFRFKKDVTNRILNGTLDAGCEYATFEIIRDACRTLHGRYAGRTSAELMEEFGIRQVSKNLQKILLDTMLKDHRTFFDMTGVSVKTIRLTRKGLRNEDLKFARIDFQALVDQAGRDDRDSRHEGFITSPFYTAFAGVHIFFGVFEGEKGRLKESVFKGFKELVFPEDFIYSSAFKAYEDTVDKVANGRFAVAPVRNRRGEVVVNPRTGTAREETNFMKSRENDVFVRGSGRDAAHKTETVCGRPTYAQHVWVKGTYVSGILSSSDYLA